MLETRAPIAARRDLLGLAAAVRVRHPVRARRDFRFGGLSILVESNSPALIDTLQQYFHCFERDWKPADGGERNGIVVTALESEPAWFPLAYRDWPRDPGKLHLKERVADLAGGRVVHKVRTGMQFLVGGSMRLAIGPCLANANQIINFIVTQYIEHHLHRGWQLCHAASVNAGGRGLILAGFAGAGKSTLALHLVGRGLDFVSNDRVLVQAHSSGATAVGVPKLPRINPGTAMNQSQLHGILPAARRLELAGLAADALWRLEEKYDVDVDAAFGPGFLAQWTRAAAFVVLAWRREDSSPPRLREASLADRPDLLAAIAKSPGPFHVGRGGNLQAPVRPDSEGYLRHLARVPLFEITGGVDFARASDLCMELLPQRGASVA
ncbi:MAG TPA: HprK-related kinase B [Candidatus Krumholzibacteria bacterium]|nr:HprK-related kinase B [Candidatus Krumholzibacteria bacterium]